MTVIFLKKSFFCIVLTAARYKKIALQLVGIHLDLAKLKSICIKCKRCKNFNQRTKK